MNYDYVDLFYLALFVFLRCVCDVLSPTLLSGRDYSLPSHLTGFDLSFRQKSWQLLREDYRLLHKVRIPYNYIYKMLRNEYRTWVSDDEEGQMSISSPSQEKCF